MSAQTIGTIGVFALTLGLLLLRHFFLERRPNSRGSAGIDAGPRLLETPRLGSKQHRHPLSTDDDRWIWTTESDSKPNLTGLVRTAENRRGDKRSSRHDARDYS